MTDIVQLKMERMVPAFEQWVRQELFTPDEVRAIAKKRRMLEYKMARKIPLREDYKRALEYERKLLTLVASRKQRMEHEFESSDHDFHVQSRIMDIYRQALKKFDDLEVWDAYLGFLIACKSFKVAQSTFVRALELHPEIPALWIKAAVFTYETCNDVSAARIFFQRALRFHPNSKEIWFAFFALECRELALLETSEHAAIVSKVFHHACSSAEMDLDDLVVFLDTIDSFGLQRLSLRQEILLSLVKRYPSDLLAYVYTAQHMPLEEAIQWFDHQPGEIALSACITFLHTIGLHQRRFPKRLIDLCTSYTVSASSRTSILILIIDTLLRCGLTEEASALVRDCRQFGSGTFSDVTVMFPMCETD